MGWAYRLGAEMYTLRQDYLDRADQVDDNVMVYDLVTDAQQCDLIEDLADSVSKQGGSPQEQVSRLLDILREQEDREPRNLAIVWLTGQLG